MDRRQSQQPQFISSYNKHCKERINLCCMLTNHCTKSACKCSQRALMFVWMTAESRGQEVVRCSQHSKIFVWVRHCLMCFCYCLLNVWWETRQKKQDGTESNSKSCGPLSQKSDRSLLSRKLGILETHRRHYQSNQTSERTSVTHC